MILSVNYAIESRDIAIDIFIKQIIKVFKEINFKNFEIYNNIELSLYRFIYSFVKSFFIFN